MMHGHGDDRGHRAADRPEQVGARERLEIALLLADAPVSSETAKHRHALISVLAWTVVVVIYAVAGVLVLVRVGLPLTQLALPAAAVGAALGFGSQRIVRDLLAGFFIVIERQYGFGDVDRFQIEGAGGETVMGTVMDVNLRITQLRTGDGDVVITRTGSSSR